MTTLVLEFTKIEIHDKTMYNTVHSNWKAESFINESGIDYLFESIHSTIILNIQNSPGNCSRWIIESVIDHNINIWKHNPLLGNSCINLPKEFDH